MYHVPYIDGPVSYIICTVYYPQSVPARSGYMAYCRGREKDSKRAKRDKSDEVREVEVER